MKASILLLTIDRFDETVKTINQNFSNHGFKGEIELLWCDNGSKDKRVIDFISKQKNLVYSRLNKVNEGVARSFNQLIIRSTGDFIYFMSNDILLPPNWLGKMAEAAFKVPRAGIVGIQCTVPPNPVSRKHGLDAHWVTMGVPGTHAIFGPMGITRECLNDVGGFAEAYETYGCEDSDFNWRVFHAGRDSFYIPNCKSVHIGNDAGSKSDYRKMKDEALKKSFQVMQSRSVGPSNFKEPLPEKREAL